MNFRARRAGLGMCVDGVLDLSMQMSLEGQSMPGDYLVVEWPAGGGLAGLEGVHCD